MPDILTRGDSELKPCPLQGHEPLGTGDTFGPGPYVSISGAPDAIQFYGVVCPGCCSTAYCASRERAVELWNTRSDGRLKENGLPASKNAVERDSVQSSPIPVGSAAPETIHISLPALRATLFRVIDTEEWRFYNWNWANSDTADAEATEHRVKFADAVCDRLCQLPARG